MTKDLIQLKGGFETTDPRLDRVPQYDERSRLFQVRQLVDRVRAEVGPNYPAHPTLDQGPDGACVGFSIATAMNSSPRRIKPELQYADALGTYKDAQRIDEWPGEAYSGTSVLAGCKIAQQRGWISAYHWCGAGSGTPIDDVVETHEKIGGVLFGIPWYRSMFHTDANGYLEVDPASGLAGYHAIYSTDFRYAPLPGQGSRKIEHLVFQNTWGSDWGGKWFGVGGCCYVKLSDIEQYLLPRNVYGEAVVLVE